MKVLRLIRTMLVGLPIWMGSCTQQEFIASDETHNESTKGIMLTLYASTQTDTRLYIDGLSMKWEDGDKLLLVDVDGNNPNVELVTTLDAPSSSAVFRSTTAVIPGTYRAFYIGNETSWDNFFKVVTTGMVEGKDMRLQSDPFTIKSGQSEVNIELKHVFCMLTFSLTGFENDKSWELGIVSNSKHIEDKKYALDAKNVFYYVNNPYRLYCYMSNGKFQNEVSILVFPEDYSAGNLTFYMTTGGSTTYSYIYEKPGKNLQAGHKYRIRLDKSQGRLVTITDGEIYTSEQLLALNYADHQNIKIMDDIDLSSVTSMKTLQTEYIMYIDGNNKTISNINISCEGDSFVGLFSTVAEVKNLTLKNITVKGCDYVGALCGDVLRIVEGCKLTGNNLIEGRNYVGGLFGEYQGGSAYKSIKNIRIESGTHVKGNEYVGGVIGHEDYTQNDIKVNQNCTVEGEKHIGGLFGEIRHCNKCYSGANVIGNSYVGGIAGNIIGSFNDINECGNIGDITASGEYVGGIVGYGEAVKSYNTGNIQGLKYVGGISGDATGSISNSFSTGQIIATEAQAGGIAGNLRDYPSIKNCYSLGDVSAPSMSGGIVGHSNRDSSIQNCYSAGNCQNQGIIGYAGSISISNCLTTSSSWGAWNNNSGVSPSDCVNITNIFANLSVINGDGIYSKDESTIWDTTLYPARCPKFNWQIGRTNIDGGIDLPGWAEEDY